MRGLAELAAAITLLTRLPAGWLVRGDWPEPARSVWAYPVVGGLVGLIGAGVLWLAARAGLPPLPASALGVAAAAWATGGLHEDGLADTFDALGGGRTAERRLAIMRDSRIGAHGSLALMLALVLRCGCLSAMPPGRAAAALAMASVLGRTSILVVLAAEPPGRAEGLAAPLGGASRIRLAGGLGAGCVLALLIEWRWAAAIVLAGLAGLWVARLARTRFGGFTGDLLGASAVLGECASLVAATGEIGLRHLH